MSDFDFLRDHLTALPAPENIRAAKYDVRMCRVEAVNVLKLAQVECANVAAPEVRGGLLGEYPHDQ